MKSTLGLLLLTATLTFVQSPATYRQKQKFNAPAVTTVLICESRSAYAYHSYACRGLVRCSHTVSRVSLADAKRMGYRACKICK